MTEYIERTDAMNAVLVGDVDRDFPCMDIAARLHDIPAADVRPVVRGKWELEYEPNGKPYCFHCSVCDGDFHYIGITTKYDFCPNCGADMRGDQDV